MSYISISAFGVGVEILALNYHAEYIGKLHPYHNQSYSRNFFKKNDTAADDIKALTGDVPTITFKAFSEDCEIHFGNSEGCNFMAGHDIAVVGTPHMAEQVYKFIAYRMGGNISYTAHYIPIVHNGFRFWFYTYDDELLRQIQLWLIQGELEQAVGRARLLRNDCTVYLFSDFPLMHSEFME